MKKLLLILIVLSFKIEAQVIGTTKPGRLIIKKVPVQVNETNPPVIALTDPVVHQGEEIKLHQKSFRIKGAVNDESEIISFSMNGSMQKLIKNKFDILFNINSERSNITLSATDKFGNKSSFDFKVFCSIDSIGPQIAIVEPKLINDKNLIAKEASQTIILEALDENGVKDVFINNLRAATSDNRQFFANVKLNPGLNNIPLIAHDVNGNVTTRNITINYSSDSEPPYIVITEPSLTRGTKVVSKKEIITVKGTATDESGVKSVYINGRKAALQGNSVFMLDMDLAIGDNAIVINAVDNKDNSGVDTFYVTRKLEDAISTGKYYALIIGVDKYNGIWPKLHNAVNDAKAVAELLNKDYKFDEFRTLYDEQASRTNIISEFERLTSVVGKDDNVLIFYSGHGEFKQQLNKGFWVPADAINNSIAGYISNNDIQTFLNGINSKHTLLISDACFSGDIFRGRTEAVPFESSERYFKEVYRRASRCALTSGGIEPVTDGGREGHSVFTYYLLKKLQDNSSKYFTAGQLFNEIQIPVTNNSEQSPNFLPIKNTGDEGGQFIFIKKTK